MSFIGEVAQEILKNWNWSGVNLSRLRGNGEGAKQAIDSAVQEQKVNRGYEQLIFSAFEADLPDPIYEKGPLDPHADFNLAAKATIGKVSDQKFARAENLISRYLPVFDPELFCSQGKVMDSWETVRHNPAGVDYLDLEWPSEVTFRYLQISTQFHDGNHPEFFSLMQWKEEKFVPLVKNTQMKGHSLLCVDLEKPVTTKKIRVSIFPDGGVSRLGLYKDLPVGEYAGGTEIYALETSSGASTKSLSFLPLEEAKWLRFKKPIPKAKKPMSIPFQPGTIPSGLQSIGGKIVNWASAANGAKVIRASNEHYGPANQVISPYPPLHMFDGLESARSREPGHFEEVDISLGKEAHLVRVDLDFHYFVNNNPNEIQVFASHSDRPEGWTSIVPRTRVKPYAGNVFTYSIAGVENKKVDRIRVRVFPDGGINRIRVWGRA